jgi:hypothetical protein
MTKVFFFCVIKNQVYSRMNIHQLTYSRLNYFILSTFINKNETLLFEGILEWVQVHHKHQPN